MTVRVSPETLAPLADGLEGSSDKLTRSKPAPEADAGPSGPAVNETLAELMRAAAGLIDETSRTADDLRSGKASYADTDASNADEIHQIRPR